MPGLWYKDLARPPNRHRYDINLRMRCEDESSSFELMHHSVDAGPALRKNNDRRSLLHLSRRRTHRFQRGSWILPINGDLTGTTKMPTQKRNREELLLCKKSKLNRQCNKND